MTQKHLDALSETQTSTTNVKDHSWPGSTPPVKWSLEKQKVAKSLREGINEWTIALRQSSQLSDLTINPRVKVGTNN